MTNAITMKNDQNTFSNNGFAKFVWMPTGFVGLAVSNGRQPVIAHLKPTSQGLSSLQVTVGDGVGDDVGDSVGLVVGDPVGLVVGDPVGLVVGDPVGLVVGAGVGGVGLVVGDRVGD